MRKILVLGVVLLVLAGALFVAASNLNRYLAENREWLADQASSALGRSVAFDKIGVSLRGGLGARVTSVAIGEDPAFGKGEFLRADRIDAVIKILPALRGRYEVARIEIDAPEINVIKTRSGFNFDSLGRTAGDQAPAAERDTPAGALPLLVSSLRIGDGRLRFIDRSKSPVLELNVEHLDFSASDVGLDRASVSMDATDAAIAYGDQFAKPKGVRLVVDADVKWVSDAIDVAKFDLHLAKAHLTGSGRIGLTPEMPVDFALSGRDVPLDGWERLIPAAAAVEATGALDFELTAKGPAGGGQIPRLDGTLGLRRVSVNQGGGDARIDDLTTTVTLKGDRAEIPPTDFKLNGNPVRIAATVKNLANLDTDFTITSPTLDVAALGAAGEGVKQREVLENIEVRGNFRSASNGPQLDATLRSTGGSLRDIAYRTLDGQASLRNRKLTFERLVLSAFEGSIDGVGSYDMAKAGEPAFSFRGKVDGIDVGALVAHFGGGHALQMSGRLQGTFDLNGRGSEWETIRRTLTGNGALEVADGVLKGVNIAESVFGGLTGIPGLSNLISPKVRSKYPALFGMDDTVFEVLAGKMTLRDGQALFDEIALAARDYRLDGKGTIGLDKALDIGMTFVASQNLTGDLIGSAKGVQYLTDANGRFNIPLRLAGSMPTIRAQPDVQYAARQLSSSLLQTGLSKGLDALIGKKRAPEPVAQGGAEPTADAPAEQSSAQPDLAEQPPAQPDAAEQPAAQPDPTEQLIRRGLGALLGGDQE
jgi:hypothetical protein